MALEERAGEIASSLPYGEQRLLEVAIALAARPSLLLLDEPVSGMNPAEKARFMGTLAKIRERGITVLLVEHDMRTVIGVSDRVITAMVNKSRRQITNVEEKPVDFSPVNEIGVYYKDHTGRWTAIDPEIVHIKSGGWLKSTATHGIIKEDRNGHLNGRESKLALQCPIELLIYVPEGVSANEYDFLSFRINSDNREFRVLTGGVFHSTGGADRDEVKFNPVKTAPHTYQFTVDKDTGGGEYGILPPGTGNVTNGGKIYTFAIVE